MTVQEIEATLESALARSALYGVLASAFRRPDSPLFRRLAKAEELDALVEAITCSGVDNVDPLRESAMKLHHCACGLDLEAITRSFLTLFGHTSRGKVPPYETEYGSGGPFFQPQEMSDISGFYQAFGLEINPSKHERMDHICCEFEFMCFLCAKQGYAIESGDHETAAEIVRAQRLFLRDHLGPFGRTFLARVQQIPDAAWHAAAAQFGSAFIEGECAHFEIALDRAYLPLRPDKDVDVPMACGSCDSACGSSDPSTE